MLASVALVAIVHVDDTYHLDNVAGAWLGLARYVNAGHLYPPLYDGSHYGGTRYMPLQILLYAGAGRLGGDYILSAKIVALVVFALLLGLVFWILRGLGCSRSLSVALSAAIPVSFSGFFAATTTYGDTLPVLFQLAAVALVSRTTRRLALVVAAALCCLAFLTKSSAVWAPVAIVVWLALREPRRVPLFALVYAGLTLGSVAGFEALTHGRFLENVRGLAFSGFLGPRAILVDSPKRLYELMRQDAQAALFLLPLALASMVVWLRRERRLSIYALSLVVSLLALLVVLADVGTDFNHLLDLIVLISLGAGEFLVWASGRQRTRPLLAGGAMLLALAALAVAAKPSDLRHDTRVAARRVFGADKHERVFERGLMAQYIAPGDSLLSEDPLIPFLLNRQPPVILDPFMLLRIVQKHPTWRAALVKRIDRHEFDKIVLMFSDLANKKLWSLHHFGVSIATAIARNYHLTRSVLGDWWYYYYIYVPRQRAHRVLSL